VVSVVRVTLDRREVTIPVGAFENLSNVAIPLGVYLSVRGQQVVVHLKGGDGENAYEARLVITGNRVVRREIQSFDMQGTPRVSTQDYPTQ